MIDRVTAVSKPSLEFVGEGFIWVKPINILYLSMAIQSRAKLLDLYIIVTFYITEQAAHENSLIARRSFPDPRPLFVLVK